MARSSDGRSVLSRHLQVLDAFAVESPFLTVSQIAHRSGLALATTHRLVADLTAQGLLERRDDRTYRLGVRLWELACRTPGALGLRELAMPTLQELHAAVRQHVQLGVLEGHEVLFLERLSMRDAVINITLVGGRLPLHASSSGLVLLANASPEVQEAVLAAPLARYTPETPAEPKTLRALLHRVRAEGYAVGDGYIYPDTRGIAVPVLGSDAAVIASVSVVVPNDDASPLPHVDLLRQASAQISESLRRAYLPASDPAAVPGGRYRSMVSSSLRSMEYLGTNRASS